jgi:hypothetical protein
MICGILMIFLMDDCLNYDLWDFDDFSDGFYESFVGVSDSVTINKFLPVVIKDFQRETKVKKNRPFWL